jgi:hypothetical protein
MNLPELLWQRLVRARGPEPLAPDPVESVPPWFARRVVNHWLMARQAATVSGGWECVSRQGLACALVIMLAAVLFHVRVPTAPQPWEVLASESVLSSVLPR